jgi:hypothetical protein
MKRLKVICGDYPKADMRIVANQHARYIIGTVIFCIDNWKSGSVDKTIATWSDLAILEINIRISAGEIPYQQVDAFESVGGNLYPLEVSKYGIHWDSHDLVVTEQRDRLDEILYGGPL